MNSDKEFKSRRKKNFLEGWGGVGGWLMKVCRQVSQFILPPGQVAPRGASQPWLACPPGGNLSRDILPPTLVTFTPGGQHIPAGLSCPPGVKLNQPGYLAPHPWTLSSNCPEILKLLLISQACINGIFHIIQIRNSLSTDFVIALIPVTRNAFDDGWGATYPSWFILPPTENFGAVTVYRYWKWLSSATLVKIMKIP